MRLRLETCLQLLVQRVSRQITQSCKLKKFRQSWHTLLNTRLLMPLKALKHLFLFRFGMCYTSYVFELVSLLPTYIHTYSQGHIQTNSNTHTHTCTYSGKVWAYVKSFKHLYFHIDFWIILIAREGNNHRYPSTDEWKMKM